MFDTFQLLEILFNWRMKTTNVKLQKITLGSWEIAWQVKIITPIHQNF